MDFEQWIESEEAFWIVQRFGLSITKDGMMLQEVFNAAKAYVKDAAYEAGYEEGEQDGNATRYMEGYSDGYYDGLVEGDTSDSFYS